MDTPSQVARAIKTVCASALVTGAIFGAGMPNAVAQSIAAYADKTINRLCTNQCVQSGDKIVVDSTGNATAMWLEPAASSTTNVLTSRFSASTGQWGAPKVLASGKFFFSNALGIDGNGNVTAVWTYNDGNGGDLVNSSRYIASLGTWTKPVIATGHSVSQNSLLVSLTVGKNGDAILFHRVGDFEGSIARFDAATSTWRHDELYITSTAKFAFDNAGNAVAADLRRYGDDSYIYTYRFDYATKTWVQSTTLDSYESTIYPDPSAPPNPPRSFSALALSVDPYGSAMAIWQQAVLERTTSGTFVENRTIKSARFLKSKNAWIAKSVARINNNTIKDTSLVADKNANVTAIWTQYVGSYARPVTARYSSSTGQWSTPKVISAGSYNTRDARIAASPSGSLFATWSQRTDTGTGSGTGKIFRATAARYSGSVGAWGAPKIIQDVNRNSYLPQMGIDSKGRAIVMWQQDSGIVRSDGSPIKQLKSDRLIPY